MTGAAIPELCPPHNLFLLDTCQTYFPGHRTNFDGLAKKCESPTTDSDQRFQTDAGLLSIAVRELPGRLAVDRRPGPVNTSAITRTS
jgi:hypothetical protein